MENYEQRKAFRLKEKLSNERVKTIHSYALLLDPEVREVGMGQARTTHGRTTKYIHNFRWNVFTGGHSETWI